MSPEDVARIEAAGGFVRWRCEACGKAIVWGRVVPDDATMAALLGRDLPQHTCPPDEAKTKQNEDNDDDEQASLRE